MFFCGRKNEKLSLGKVSGNIKQASLVDAPNFERTEQMRHFRPHLSRVFANFTGILCLLDCLGGIQIKGILGPDSCLL